MRTYAKAPLKVAVLVTILAALAVAFCYRVFHTRGANGHDAAVQGVDVTLHLSHDQFQRIQDLALHESKPLNEVVFEGLSQKFVDNGLPPLSREPQKVQLGTVVAVLPVKISTMFLDQSPAIEEAGVAVCNVPPGAAGGDKTVLNSMNSAPFDLAAFKPFTAPGLWIAVRIAGSDEIRLVAQDAQVPVHVGERVDIQTGSYRQPTRVVPLS